MLLSACYIVKNEQKRLIHSIISIKSLVDEIIVVDTGSTDNTLSVAKKYTDKVFYYTWQNNFAAARNFAISKARGKWIIFLDADENAVINNTKKIRNTLLNTLSSEVYLIKIINIDGDKNNKYIDNFYAQRIFINNNVFYSGQVHEHLVKKSGDILKTSLLAESDIYIYHTGYSSSMTKIKAERNLNLLRNMDISDPITVIELAEAYNGVGDRGKALYYANQAVKKGRLPITYASRPYRLLINLLEERNAGQKVIRQAIKLAMADFPELPDFSAEYANILADGAQYGSAIVYMKKALELEKNYHDIEPTIFDDEKIVLAGQLINQWQQIINRAGKIKISACLIVKNESKNIIRWYNSISGCSDEQIVVDTGSTDDTVKILKKLPVRLYYYQWHDNFAAAKNYAIDKAKGDWIIFIDADQYFTKESVDKIRFEIAKADVSIIAPKGIFIIEINIEEKTGQEIGRSYSVRIFRNDNDLRYIGQIHEELHYNKQQNFTVIKNDILQIYHTGYSADYSHQKAKRNLALLLSDKYRKNGVMLWHYIADCYYGLGDYEKTVKCSRKYFLENKYHVINGESSVWNTYINAMLKLDYSQEQILQEIEKAIDKFPELPDFYALAGITLFNAGKRKEAEKYLVEALNINKKNINLDVKDSTAFSMYLPTVQKCMREINIDEKGKKVNVLLPAINNKKTLGKNEKEDKNNMKTAMTIDDMLGKAAENIQWLFLTLISQERLDTKYLKFLPVEIERIVQQFFTEVPVLSGSDLDAYNALRPMVFKHASDSVLERYVLLANNLDITIQKKVIAELLKIYKWKAAYALLKCIEKSKLDTELLYDYARCLYYLDELDAAEKYFLQAKSAGYSNEKINSYLTWVSDRRNNKW
ncbi:glycosyltransferase family 2 protein [Pectinatus frisingensis]|uniref:glycosyltransferase family 2 protein n=1 Tax=Pectinatus frisingensis TaxID=865 RepID=UPI0018C4F832|nr:glycosyltransferase family 2 protein [Pectinatus frisingensis]